MPALPAQQRDSTVDEFHGSEIIHLSDIYAVVSKNRVCSRDVEKHVRYRDLEQIVDTFDDFAGRPGKPHLFLARLRVLLSSDALDEGKRLSNTLAQLVDGLLVVLVLWRRLAGQPSGCTLYVVARALNLIDKVVLNRVRGGSLAERQRRTLSLLHTAPPC